MTTPIMVAGGVIWSQSEDCFQSLSVDPDSFNEGDLEVLRERPWQQMWRIHLQDFQGWMSNEKFENKTSQEHSFFGGDGVSLKTTLW